MISLRSFNTHPKHRIKNRGTLFIARSVFKKEAVNSAAVNIIFVNDSRMIRLNGTFLGKRRRTDVISFTLNSPGENIDGEIYIDIDQARRQAREYGVSYKNEYARLIIHGLLHLIGYGDDNPRRKKRMSRREDSILKEIADCRYEL